MSSEANQTGQSLLEVTLTIGVGVLVITALIIITLLGLKNSQLAQAQAQATKYAQEGIETIRSLKVNGDSFTFDTTTTSDWTSDIWTKSFSCITPNCTYVYTNCPGASCNFASKPNANIGDQIGTTQFYRKIVIEDAGALDTKKITCVVSWKDATGTRQSQLTTYLARY